MKKKKNNGVKVFFTLVFISLIGLIGYNLYIMYQNIEIKDNLEYEAKRTAVSTNYEENVNNIPKESKVVDMLEEITKSVVGISKLSNAGGSILSNVSSDELGLGTGVVVSENGYILSNSHVTGERFSTCYVTIDEKTYKGTVVWSEAELDLSIVKVIASGLKYVDLGDSKNIKVGQSVYAIGNPIGYEFKRTVTSGIISALNRTIKIEENEQTSYISDLIQTDATINPGNSGGPLVNTNGEVIGINTVKITSAEGIGFAIPINVIKPVIESFRTNNSFEEATLGIYAYDSEVAEYLKLKNRKQRGVYVSQIMPNSPAVNSDLREGDLITKIDGKELNTINDLRENIYEKTPNTEVNLSILRDNKEMETVVNLGKK